MKADNIFQLIKGGKEKEDQLSASYAYLLTQNRKLLSAFLKSIDVDYIKKPLIETQKTYRMGTTRRIDIHISLPEEYLVIIESKVRDNQADIQQLKEYASILRPERQSYKKIRLILVTQTNQKKLFWNQFYPSLELEREEVYYCRWNQLIELWKSNRENNAIDKMFEKYIGDEMEDIKYTKDKMVGELKELMVISITDDFFPLHIKQKGVWNNMSRRLSDCQFVAMYRTSPTKAITHFGRVVKISEWFPCIELYKGSKFEEEAKKWGHEKILFVDKWIELPKPIPLGKQFNRVRRLFYSEVSKLLTAKTTDDL